MPYARLAGALAVVALAAPASAITVLDYSLISLGNYADAGGSRIGGAVAVAGNARINSTAIGTRLGADRNGTNVVVAGGNVSFDNSTLAYGNVAFGGSNGSGRWTQAATPGGSFVQAQPLDFAGVASGLLGLSAQYGSMATSGSFTSQWGSGTLSGGRSVGTDVFTLTTSQLSSLYALRLVGTAGSKAIINVSGASFGSYLGFDRGQYAVSDVTFNFLDAQTLSLGGSDIAASVLAPRATLIQSGGTIRGAVAVGNFYGAGTRIDGDGAFAIADMGALVPEPTTWAMMIVGFGMVGVALRRRTAERLAQA